MSSAGGRCPGTPCWWRSGWPPVSPIRCRGASDRCTPFCPCWADSSSSCTCCSRCPTPPPPAGRAHAVHASGLVPGFGMLVAHGWAIGLTALWLARGEAVLWTLLRRLAVRLLAVLLPPWSETPFCRAVGGAAGAPLGRAAARGLTGGVRRWSSKPADPFRRPPPAGRCSAVRVRKACSCSSRHALLLAAAVVALSGLRLHRRTAKTADTVAQSRSTVAAEARPPAGAAAGLSITDPWVKTAEKGMTAAFGTLVNNTDAEVTIVSGASPAVAEDRAARGRGSDGKMVMRPKEGGFVIPAARHATSCEPGGDHIMLMGVTDEVKPGARSPSRSPCRTAADASSPRVGKDFAGGNEDVPARHGRTSSMAMMRGRRAGDSVSRRAPGPAPLAGGRSPPAAPRRRCRAASGPRRRRHRPRRPPDPAGVEPFHGPHQAGIATPPQAHAVFVGLDLLPGIDREALGRLMQLLTDDARRLTQGRPALADTEPELAHVPGPADRHVRLRPRAVRRRPGEQRRRSVAAARVHDRPAGAAVERRGPAAADLRRRRAHRRARAADDRQGRPLVRHGALDPARFPPQPQPRPPG